MTQIAYGKNARLTATPTPNTQYVFNGWLYNGEALSNENKPEGIEAVEVAGNIAILKNVTANVSGIIAMFISRQPEYVNVEATADPQDGGRVDIEQSE